MDPEEQELALAQAERDREIAMRRAALPVTLYENVKIFSALKRPIVLCDLDDVSVRMRLAQTPAVADAMRACAVQQLDRSIITAQGPHLEITRAISGFLMREEFEGQRFAGIRTISRWKGEVFVLFHDCYEIDKPIAGPISLHRGDSDVVDVATMTGLVP